MTARTGKDPGQIYRELTQELGDPVYERIEAPATGEQKAALAGLAASDIRATSLAGQPIQAVLTAAPGNGSFIGGIKVVAKDGWFAARPSGTEQIYKIYAESFIGQNHLKQIQAEAQSLLAETLAGGAQTTEPKVMEGIR